ncbi:MAG: phycobiliprotein lyase [Hydrococcus sp. RU_2_2]|jgi:CpeS-like protein|nr:phycobiliprotein lyase [Hydrococcus sp. RU_2_2]NJP22564.1 phycobiliprotein lyase [Hydrococcus sp. CRU_1_1]
MDIIEFFQLSAGKWRSHRMTHHLVFKAAERGDSDIEVEFFAAAHQDVIRLCEMHEIDSSLAVGGSHVHWKGTMQWDFKKDDNHEGETVFAIVPDAGTLCQGRLLRERGYAEIVPVVGRYQIDDAGVLLLTTEYETMSVIERFWFVSPDIRMRLSVVKLYGGFSNAALCIETRIEEALEAQCQTSSTPKVTSFQPQKMIAAGSVYSVLGW